MNIEYNTLCVPECVESRIYRGFESHFASFILHATTRSRSEMVNSRLMTTSQKSTSKQKSVHMMSINERILFEMEAIKTKKHNAITAGKSLKHDEMILFEMEAIKKAPRGEETRKCNLLRQPFAYFAASLFSKRRDCNRDQIYQCQNDKRNAKQGWLRRKLNNDKNGACFEEPVNLFAWLRRKLNNDKNGACFEEPVNLFAPAESFSFLALSSKMPYKSSHDAGIDRNRNPGIQRGKDEETTEQEMTQNTLSSRRPKYTWFDEEEQELDNQSNSTLSSLYTYKDSPTSCRGDDFSTCHGMSMSTIGGSSMMISDWASVNWRLNGQAGRAAF
jgi:hypothetical protein